LTLFLTLLSDGTWRAFVQHAESLTIFAPRDAAFAALPREIRAAMFTDAERRRAVLANHLVRDRLVAADLMERDSVMVLSGRNYAIDSVLGLQIDGAYLVRADMLIDQGVLHIIDAVLIP
jgi:uncharacterized surface protein with fasciclin (FAS1) repeats